MKKLIMLFFVLISIFLFGCQLQQQQPQLALEGTNDAIASKQQPYTSFAQEVPKKWQLHKKSGFCTKSGSFKHFPV